MKRISLIVGTIGIIWSALTQADSGRRPVSDEELRYWLENAIAQHGFSIGEAAAATDLYYEDVLSAMDRFGIVRGGRPRRSKGDPLRVTPYPGGRHPRIGFLDGAIDPQRETKISVFPPWNPSSYVVVDVPEAIWSNLGLTYLAHTHIPTVWTEQGIDLPPLEWTRHENGELSMERTLPNGIRFGTRVRPEREAVRMEMWLANGTSEKLTDLRVQNCIMLKGAPAFNAQTDENVWSQGPYIARRAENADRWILTAWSPLHRVWQNPPVPCIHSDPKFPDCAPGETVRIWGWLSFYEGDDIEGEVERIEKLEWRP